MELATGNVSYTVAAGNTSIAASNDSMIEDNPSNKRSSSLPDEYYHLIRDIYFVLIGVVIILGLAFNTLALAVFATSRVFRSTTTAHYLMALSVADSLCLTMEIFRWLPQSNNFGVGVNVLNTSNVLCKWVYVLRYLGHMSSAWTTVAITTERFVTIRFPLKVTRISTTTRARIMIGTIFSVCGILSLYPIWLVGLDDYKGKIICMVTNRRLYEVGMWLTIRLGVLFVPSIIVCALTAYIIYHLKARNRLQYHLQPHNALQRQAKIGTPTSLDKQLTGMLVAVAGAFVILRLPYIVLYYINQEKSKIWDPIDPYLKYDIYVAYKLSDVLAVTNYAVNFFLYFVCGSTFRKQLAALFNCRKSVTRRASLTIGTMSSFFSRRASQDITQRSERSVSKFLKLWRQNSLSKSVNKQQVRHMPHHQTQL